MMTKPLYFVSCGSKDEDGFCDIGIDRIDNFLDNAQDANEYLCQFLSQTDPSYINDKGFIIEIYEGVNQLFGKYIDDLDDSTIQTLYDDLTEYDRQDIIDIIKPEINKLKEKLKEEL